MPVEFQVIRASDFVCFDAEEHLDFEASKKVLQELAMACRKRGLECAMVDLRDLPVPPKPRFTRGELVEMAGAFRAAGFSRGQRLAVLYREDVHGTIRDFTEVSRAQGLQVRAFHEFDNAIHWLGKATEHPLEHKHGIEVPIVRKNKTKSKRATRRAPTPLSGAATSVTARKSINHIRPIRPRPRSGSAPFHARGTTPE